MKYPVIKHLTILCIACIFFSAENHPKKQTKNSRAKYEDGYFTNSNIGYWSYYVGKYRTSGTNPEGDFSNFPKYKTSAVFTNEVLLCEYQDKLNYFYQ